MTAISKAISGLTAGGPALKTDVVPVYRAGPPADNFSLTLENIQSLPYMGLPFTEMALPNNSVSGDPFAVFNAYGYTDGAYQEIAKITLCTGSVDHTHTWGEPWVAGQIKFWTKGINATGTLALRGYVGQDGSLHWGNSGTSPDSGHGHVYVEHLWMKGVHMNAAFTASQLPNPATYAYCRTFCSDANSTTFNATVVGGGANVVPVFSNGTVWKIG